MVQKWWRVRTRSSAQWTFADVRLQPLRISKAQRIPTHIAEGINTPRQPNRVRLPIPSLACVILPVPVLQQPGFRIKHLPRKARVVDERAQAAGVLIGRGRPKRLRRVPAPHDRLIASARDHARRGQMVRVHVVHMNFEFNSRYSRGRKFNF